jgi:hypothetical protein
MIAFDIERILYTEHLGWGRLQRAESLVPAVSFHSAELNAVFARWGGSTTNTRTS